MTTLDIYKAHYEEERSRRDGEYTKYEWAASYIFDLYTYDASLDEKFVKSIIEVSKAIIDMETFYYIENSDNYLKYIYDFHIQI